MKTALMIAASILGTVSWTDVQAVSEETPPYSCGGTLMRGISCYGNYCDRIYPQCGDDDNPNTTNFYVLSDVFWTRFISEEPPASSTTCYHYSRKRARYEYGAIIGMACNGNYCDNISVECAELEYYVPASSSTACYYTSLVSEEGTGKLFFKPFHVAIRMYCFGSNCDNKQFRVCPLIPR